MKAAYLSNYGHISAVTASQRPTRCISITYWQLKGGTQSLSEMFFEQQWFLILRIRWINGVHQNNAQLRFRMICKGQKRLLLLRCVEMRINETTNKHFVLSCPALHSLRNEVQAVGILFPSSFPGTAILKQCMSFSTQLSSLMSKWESEPSLWLHCATFSFCLSSGVSKAPKALH